MSKNDVTLLTTVPYKSNWKNNIWQKCLKFLDLYAILYDKIKFGNSEHLGCICYNNDFDIDVTSLILLLQCNHSGQKDQFLFFRYDRKFSITEIVMTEYYFTNIEVKQIAEMGSQNTGNVIVYGRKVISCIFET